MVNLQFAITVSVGRAKMDLCRTDHRIKNRKCIGLVHGLVVAGSKAANRVAMGYLVIKLLHIH